MVALSDLPLKEAVAGGAAIWVALLNRSASKKASEAATTAKDLGVFLKDATLEMQKTATEQSKNLRAALRVVDKLASKP